MINILCFGDSNTYGFVPFTGLRFDRNTRWTGVLQKLLGEDYYVIEEGLNGRTTAYDDPIDFEDMKNGRKYLPTAISTHIPLDLVIIMLGTNDTKYRFGATSFDIAKALGKMAAMVRSMTAEKNFDGKPAKVLIVSPIRIGEGMRDASPFREEFGGRSIGIAEELAGQIELSCGPLEGVYTFDAKTAAEPSGDDDLHMDAENHRRLAEALEKEIRRILAE